MKILNSAHWRHSRASPHLSEKVNFVWIFDPKKNIEERKHSGKALGNMA